MKSRIFLIAIVYCVLSISTKLILFYGSYYNSPMGRLGPFILLGMILPFVVFIVYLKRKENGGVIGGKEAVRQGLIFVSIIAVVMTAFDYIFYVAEMKDFYTQFFTNTDYHELLKEKLKHEKNASMLDVVRQQMLYEQGFKYFSLSRALFPIFAFGLFSSFISGVFMKRG
ncbi:MAG: hypothetical protein K0S33_6 [Bacteroidetes bacterium]|jgi:hypothetical protein|nr:hypothetical protein [Bacteroidota bacterium]